MVATDAPCIQPCAWAADVWKHCGFPAERVVVWPVGIDTVQFQPSDVSPTQRRVLVYHKGRSTDELAAILGHLHQRQTAYRLLLYGSYREEEFQALLAQASAVVWHGGHESQGLALLEALAANVPILVCDVRTIGDTRTGAYAFPERLRALPATAAPYFDESCGMRITELSAFPEALDTLLTHLHAYAPRDFILRHLTLAGQARAFVAIWERWGLTETQGRLEAARTVRPLRAPLGHRLRMALQALRS